MYTKHQYINRITGKICNERLSGDRAVNFLYSNLRENAPTLFNALISPWASNLLGIIHYKSIIGAKLFGNKDFFQSLNINYKECLDSLDNLDTLEKIFERKIRYWDCRPMPSEETFVVSPCDARVLLGLFRDTSKLFIKKKFFSYEELLANGQTSWTRLFLDGDFAIFRLTPEKYHYNHTPVSGKIVDFYEIDGVYHSCNPSAVITLMTPYSKNKRIVTIIDTNVAGGSNIGIVAMVEIVALAIGKIIQCYSETEYKDPLPAKKGMFINKGVPKSLYRPGSSTTVLIFQKNMIKFAEDLILNMHNKYAESRFSIGFKRPLIESDVNVRSYIATQNNSF